MDQALFELSQRVSRAPGIEDSAGFTGDTDFAALAGLAERITWVQSIDLVVDADGEFSILDGAGGDPLVGPIPGVAGVQYTFGPLELTAGAAVQITTDGATAGGSITYRRV